jgi:hypothetical protein
VSRTLLIFRVSTDFQDYLQTNPQLLNDSTAYFPPSQDLLNELPAWNEQIDPDFSIMTDQNGNVINVPNFAGMSVSAPGISVSIPMDGRMTAPPPGMAIPLPAPPPGMAIPLPAQNTIIPMADSNVSTITRQLVDAKANELIRRATLNMTWDLNNMDIEMQSTLEALRSEQYFRVKWGRLFRELKARGIDVHKVTAPARDEVADDLGSFQLFEWQQSLEHRVHQLSEPGVSRPFNEPIKASASIQQLYANQSSSGFQMMPQIEFWKEPEPESDPEPEPELEPVPEPEPEPEPEFHYFTALPFDAREKIYKMVLFTGQPIKPHFCDHDDNDPTKIKFHDDAQEDEHDAVFKLFRITEVSKLIRTETLPVFYSVNTFIADQDTPTYFDRLSHVGRFHMIRHVTFVIDLKSEEQAPKSLRCLHQLLKEQKIYEEPIITANINAAEIKKQEEAEKNTPSSNDFDSIPFVPDHSKFHTDLHDVLLMHPQHIGGGLREIGTFLVLRMLASEFTSTTSAAFTHKLVICVPFAELFEHHPFLRYFPQICAGLGIELELVKGQVVDETRGVVSVQWHQRYQKKETLELLKQGSGSKTLAPEKMLETITKAFPRLEELPRPVATEYYRTHCHGEPITWFRWNTDGGPVW